MDRYKIYEIQSLFGTNDEKIFDKETFFLKNIIEDRQSKFSGTCAKVLSKQDVQDILKYIKKYKFYQKAIHNIYSYRILQKDGSILEGKNDDGEIGGGNCILQTMKKRKIINCIIIITRYFGGIHLNADRFKHIVDATGIVIDKAFE